MNRQALRQLPFARPWLRSEDRAAVMEVLNGTTLTNGPQCRTFEREFATRLGPTAHAVAVSSCMAALHMACLQFGVGSGDEVIVPALTHIAAAHAVEWVGATPVFIDCEQVSGNITAEAIEAAISTKTRAISVVHFAGIPCDMPQIMDLAERHELKVIEDCALALGARHRGTHVGLFGDAGCFSFYPAKHITTGEGGMFVSRHRSTAEHIVKLRAFGVDRTPGERIVPGMYDVPELGLNYRMGEMQAALGRAQLSRLPENLQQRRANFQVLKGALTQVPGLQVLDAAVRDASSSYYCLIALIQGITVEGRNGLIGSLNARGVGTSIYYPQPVPRMGFYRRRYGYDASRFAVAEAISDGSIALPVGPHLTEDDMEYIGTAVREVLAGQEIA